MVVRFGGGPHDHLGALPGGSKPGRFAGNSHFLPAGGTGNGDLLHGPENGVPPLVRGQQGKALLAGQLNVDRKAVGQIAQLFQQLGAGARDGFGMDVAPEVILPPQQPQDGEHPLGGVVRADEDGAGEKQPLNVVAAVKLHGQLGKLPGGERRPGQIVGLAVDAVAAIERAAVGHQHL